MPCQEWFDAQDQAYRETVLPRGVKARVSVEACVGMSWRHLVGDDGETVSIEHYGASAPYQVLFEQFGFTADNVVAKAHASLARISKITGSTTGN
jgi:transketolase